MKDVQNLSLTRQELLQLQEIYREHLQSAAHSDIIHSILIELTTDNASLIQKLFSKILIIIEHYQDLNNVKQQLEVHIERLVDENVRLKESEQVYWGVIQRLQTIVQQMGQNKGKDYSYVEHQFSNSRHSDDNKLSNMQKYSKKTYKDSVKSIFSHQVNSATLLSDKDINNPHMSALTASESIQYYRLQNETLKEEIILKDIEIELALIVLQEERNRYVKINHFSDCHTTPLKDLFNSNSVPTFASFSSANHQQRSNMMKKQHSLMQDFIQSQLEYLPDFQENILKSVESITENSSERPQGFTQRESNIQPNKAQKKKKSHNSKAINVNLSKKQVQNKCAQTEDTNILRNLYKSIYESAITNRIKT